MMGETWVGRLRWHSYVGLGVTLGMLVTGCGPSEPPRPEQPTGELAMRLAALDDCVKRSQQAVQELQGAGVSAAMLAPINTSIADAQDAADGSRKLFQQGKQQEAADRAAKGLDDCRRTEGMTAKARQDAGDRRARAQLSSEAEARAAQVSACLDETRPIVSPKRQLSRAKSRALAPAKAAFDSSEAGLRQGRELIAQGDPRAALDRLGAAQEDCQKVKDATMKPASARGAKSKGRRAS